MKGVIILAILAIVFTVIYLFADHVITIIRVEQNQKAWNEYSKDMTDSEKLNCFGDWLSMRKNEKGWKYFYVPRL